MITFHSRTIIGIWCTHNVEKRENKDRYGGRMPLFFQLFFFLYNRYIHTTFIHKHSLRPIAMSSQLSAQWAETPWVAELRSELGPALQLQQASVLPTKPRCTLLSHAERISRVSTITTCSNLDQDETSLYMLSLLTLWSNHGALT